MDRRPLPFMRGYVMDRLGQVYRLGPEGLVRVPPTSSGNYRLRGMTVSHRELWAIAWPEEPLRRGA